MPRYIDADAVIAAVRGRISMPVDNLIVEMIRDIPTISPDEVRGVGEWEDAKQHGLCRCSVCKDCYIEKDYITQAKWEYCPSCGARMKGGAD